MTISRLNSNKVLPYNAETGAVGWDVLTASAAGPNVELSWTATAGATGYVVQIEGQPTIDVGNVTSYTVTGLTPSTSYNFSVRAYNGSGVYSSPCYRKAATPTAWNAASGGTESTVTNYNGTGQTWKVHTFTSNGTLTITSASQSFRTLVAGGGGGGGNRWSSSQGGGGGAGGQVLENSNTTLTTGAKSVTIGGGTGMNTAEGASGQSGGATTFDTITANGGSGGCGGCGGGGGAGPVSGGTTSSINGTSTMYAQNGGSGGTNPNAGPHGAGYGSGGGGAVCGSGSPNHYDGGSGGSAGVVVVAYRIA